MMNEQGSIATIGFFDGVHCGHRYILEQLRYAAVERGLQSTAVTFLQHPLFAIAPRTVPPLLTTTEERKQMLSLLADNILMLDFQVFRSLTAVEFMRYLKQIHGTQAILMGYDHRFGADRLCHFAEYQAAARQVGVEIIQTAEYPHSDTHISSTAIRRLLTEGQIQQANRLLGYAYALRGTVVHGKGLGRQIGFPTANLLPADPQKLIPHNGVYHTRIEHHEQNHSSMYEGLLNIGTTPTVGGTQRTIEVHIAGFEGDLYGKELTLHLLRFIRPEQHFRSLSDLKHQIECDLTAFLTDRTENTAK